MRSVHDVTSCRGEISRLILLVSIKLRLQFPVAKAPSCIVRDFSLHRLGSAKAGRSMKLLKFCGKECVKIVSMSPIRLRGVVRYRKLLVYSGQVVTEVTRLI